MEQAMRRQDRKISTEEAIELLKSAEYGVLCMCSPENEGYGIPISFVYDSERIYFHCATEGTKLNYLNAHPKASFCVVGSTRVLPAKFGTLYESAIATGTVTEAEGEEKQAALLLFLQKYSSEFIPEGIDYIQKLEKRVKVLKLSIQSISGKARKM